MKTLKFIAILFIGTLFVTSCSKSKAVKTATLMCDCSKDMVAIQEKFKSTPDSLKQNMMEEVMAASDKMMKCMGGEEAMKKLEEGMDKEAKEKFGNEVKAAMEKSCPDVAKALDRN
jgi:hypothetical protein